jgi:hypothetical protein
MVMPREWARHVPQFTQALSERYPSRPIGKFLVWKLTPPPATEPIR